MRNTVLSYLLLPLFTCLSFSLSAAPSTSTFPQGSVQVAAQSAKPHAIDLNQADAAMLQNELSGIGKTKAEAIVAYREANGPFQSVDELLEIKGIGNALLDRNRDKLTVE
ncbi:ComEA family DNA-binding protein [Pseudomonas entomophila]|uniref:ComEA family DNA-binding protein n=1 Tax=Pseudomonas entomophila TaxID=312306 RepID=UPI0023D7C84B|nr:ComEA family DNA-binding protein [Pseudomonas entomophila]MDF0732661.1 ComEA family DNA-binding protein [Pseudomonas entomophila]